MIEIKSKNRSFSVNFPQDINEITPEILNAITANIKLPKYYCIVALAFNTKVFDFCAAMNSNKDTNISVVPILAKISDEDSKDINANVGDKIIIDRSSLERGVHVNVKTAISSNSARKYLNSDPDLVKAILTKDNKSVVDNKLNKQLIAAQSPNIIVLEFKICSINDISAAIDNNVDTFDPFIIRGNSDN